MPIELVVPSVGESITEVQIGAWLKKTGDFVQKDEPVVEIESDKATVEVAAPVSGTLSEILLDTGEQAKVGDIIGYMEAGEASQVQKADAEDAGKAAEAAKMAEAKPAAVGDGKREKRVMPAAQRVLAQAGAIAEAIEGTGPGGRVLKEDALRHVEERKAKPAPAPGPKPAPPVAAGARAEETVAMSPMRKRIAQQLVQAQQTAALLTTFNEIDMSAVIALRNKYKDVYAGKYGIKLGFMSFFVKASIEALKQFPGVNAEIRGTDIVYKNYYDIGIAVGGGKGLVVPVLRNAERMSFAEIEETIGDFARRAQENKISLEELKGGTFTISNGGIYGSLLSTPIVNPPQSGILGMHKIEERPVIVNGQIVARPMMYVALTYDHRIVDGREAVSFLVRIKECIEDPSRILLEV